MATKVANNNGRAKATTRKRSPAVPNEVRVEIPAANLKTHSFCIVGDAPYVQNRFSQRSIDEMRFRMEHPGQKMPKTARDFKREFEQSSHRDTAEGWYGIPAPAIRSATIRACKLIPGLNMTDAKMSIVVLADGVDEDGTPLVRITKGLPHYVEHVVRVQMTTDVRIRSMWDPGWEAKVRLSWDGDQFSTESVANILYRAGKQVGIGEGRPFSRSSAGMGWGTFGLK